MAKRQLNVNTDMKPTPQFINPRYKKSQEKKKIGFDLHGVIDANSDFFRLLLKDLIKQGWEIHIITGARWEKEKHTLRKLKIPFTHFFSIIDYHTSIGTSIQWDKEGNPHMDDYKWSQTKAIYCKAHGINMHFDDSDTYGFFFKTPYLRYYSKDSARVKKTRLPGQ